MWLAGIGRRSGEVLKTSDNTENRSRIKIRQILTLWLLARAGRSQHSVPVGFSGWGVGWQWSLGKSCAESLKY